MASVAPTINIAVFGDLHGRVLLPFYLAARWEQERGEKLHYALSVGDLGIYRSFERMERTSQRWAKKHPEELGFSKFFFRFDPYGRRIVRHPTVDAVLEQTRVKLLFVPGNHEEHAYLRALWERHASSAERPVAVDKDWVGLEEGRYSKLAFCGYGRLLCLPQGRAVSLDGPLDEATWLPRGSLDLFAVNGLDKYTDPQHWSAERAGSLDLLLSHETYLGRLRGVDPAGGLDEAGSERLRELIRGLGPRYHLFGHYHRYCEPVSLPSNVGPTTASVGLHQVYFGRTGKGVINQGCFGILRAGGPGQLSLEMVADDWFARLSYADCVAFL